MSATVYLSESNGAGEVVTDNIPNINMGSFDMTSLVPANHPIVKPTAGFHYGFTKFLRVKLSALNGSTSISALRVWKSAGALKAGEELHSNTDDFGGGRWTDSLFHTPLDNGMAATHTTDLNFGTTLPTIINLGITAGASQDTGTNVAPGAGSLTVNGTYSRYFCLSIRVDTTIATGALNQKTISIQYDEA